MYISQLIRYSSTCGSYHDILDKGSLLTRKLLNQWLLVVKLKLSLRKFYGHHYNLVNRYGVSVHKWPRICSVCRNHNPVLSSLRTYHKFCNKSNTTGGTCWAGTAYPSRRPEFAPVFTGVRVARSVVFCVMLCRSLFVLLSFFVSAISLSVLRLTDPGYPFGIC